MNKRNWVFNRAANCLLATLLGMAGSAVATTPVLASSTGTRAQFAELSLEELMDIEVTSVSKRSERLSDAAAAIYVLTSEDIRRSTATSIPELLRLVPGVQVSRIDSNKWAITIRGFAERFSNKILVLIDGRSVYTPLFAGVYWDVQDTVLEDIDRIEVVRGPGGTLWGANAVNGVINIITKKASDTQGSLVTSGYGTEEQGFATVRQGGRIGKNAYYRAYAKFFNRDDFVDSVGKDAGDQWHSRRGGFRLDWEPSDSDALTLQGDIYDGNSGDPNVSVPSLTSPTLVDVFNDKENFAGGNILGRWTRELAGGSSTKLQAYYDRTERDIPRFTHREYRDTFDIDFQHNTMLGKRHEIVWGAGYRLSSDDLAGGFAVSYRTSSRNLHVFSAFVQDDIILLPDRLRLTIGSKFEHNSVTGFEVQPNLRFSWKPSDRQTVWGAVSRAVRTPSRAEDDIRISAAALPANTLFPGAPPALTKFFGDRSFDSEKLLAFELGYRRQLGEALSVDIATFYNNYDDLRSIAPRADAPPFLENTPAPPHLVVPLLAGNFLGGSTYGIEVSGDWLVTESWRLRAGYTYLEIALDLDQGGAGDPISESQEDASPHNQVFVHSLLDLPRGLQLDTTLRYADNLSSQDVSSYVTMDARLAWRPIPALELALVGRNLIDSLHREFAPSSLVRSEATRVERSYYVKMTWSY